MSDDLVKRLRDCANGIGSFKSDKSDFGLCDDAADRISALEAQLADVEARPAGVKVKPLVWSGKNAAPTPFGNYVAAMADNQPDGDEFWFLYFAGKPYGKAGEHQTLEAAKTAAQADYEKRILSALEPTPVGVEEAAQRVRAFLDELERRAVQPRSTVDPERIASLGVRGGMLTLTVADLRALSGEAGE